MHVNFSIVSRGGFIVLRSSKFGQNRVFMAVWESSEK